MTAFAPRTSVRSQSPGLTSSLPAHRRPAAAQLGLQRDDALRVGQLSNPPIFRKGFGDDEFRFIHGHIAGHQGEFRNRGGFAFPGRPERQSLEFARLGVGEGFDQNRRLPIPSGHAKHPKPLAFAVHDAVRFDFPKPRGFFFVEADQCQQIHPPAGLVVPGGGVRLVSVRVLIDLPEPMPRGDFVVFGRLFPADLAGHSHPNVRRAAVFGELQMQRLQGGRPIENGSHGEFPAHGALAEKPHQRAKQGRERDQGFGQHASSPGTSGNGRNGIGRNLSRGLGRCGL